MNTSSKLLDLDTKAKKFFTRRAIRCTTNISHERKRLFLKLTANRDVSEDLKAFEKAVNKAENIPYKIEVGYYANENETLDGFVILKEKKENREEL